MTGSTTTGLVPAVRATPPSLAGAARCAAAGRTASRSRSVRPAGDHPAGASPAAARDMGWFSALGRGAVAESGTQGISCGRSARELRHGAHDPQLVRLADAIAQRVGQQRFHVWFNNSTRLDLRQDALEIAVPNDFISEWIGKNFTRPDPGGGPRGAGLPAAGAVQRRARAVRARRRRRTPTTIPTTMTIPAPRSAGRNAKATAAGVAHRVAGVARLR